MALFLHTMYSHDSIFTHLLIIYMASFLRIWYAFTWLYFYIFVVHLHGFICTYLLCIHMA